MKIGIINSVYKIGSTGRIAHELQQYIKSNSNHFAKVYYGRGKHQNDEMAYNFSLPLSVFFHGLGSRLFDRTGFYSRISTSCLIKKLAMDQIDTVILINLHGYYLNLPILFKFLKKHNIKVYYSLEDCWSFTGHCSHFLLSNCEKWKSVCYSCPSLSAYPKSLFIDNSRRNFLQKKQLILSVNPTIISPCLWLKSVLKESFLKNCKITTIYNGVDTTIFRKKQNDFRRRYNLQDKKIILCISWVWCESKGIKDIISLSNMIEKNEVIILVGEISKKTKLPNNIIHIDKTNNVEELVEIYSSSDVLFNPTYEDTFPTINLEAYACELPIVCYKTGGTPETVDINYVIEQGDINNALTKIHEILNNFKSYSFPKLDISKDTTYKQYLDLINSK